MAVKKRMYAEILEKGFGRKDHRTVYGGIKNILDLKGKSGVLIDRALGESLNKFYVRFENIDFSTERLQMKQHLISKLTNEMVEKVESELVVRTDEVRKVLVEINCRK